MKKDYIEFKKGLPVKINLYKIRNYPLTWQNSLRILLVLEGEISVGMENEEYKLKKNHIEIINQEEIYYIKSEGENKVLVMDIHPDFFSRYKKEVDGIYFYTNTLNSNQKDEKYIELREHIALISYNYLEQKLNYREIIEDEMIKLMFHLLNNFHYLLYEEESLSADYQELERFSRIITHIRKNYNDKVTLKNIASKEDLTPQYLSFKIKDTFGQNFNDFLNKIRVEESRKLLLASNKSISQIALDSGFSHIRYYNKHFYKIYGKKPLDYRKDYQKNTSKKEIICLDKQILPSYLSNYLYHDSFHLKNKKLKTHDINIKKDVDRYRSNKIIFWISRIEEALDILNYKIIEENKDELGIEVIYIEESPDNLSPYKIKFIQEAYENIGIRLTFNKENISSKKLEKSLDLSLFKIDKNQLSKFNSLIDNFLNTKEDIYLRLFSSKSNQGVFTQDGIKTNYYYLVYILTKTWPGIFYKKADIIGSREGVNFDIFVWNQEKDKILENSINISGMEDDYYLYTYIYKKSEETHFFKTITNKNDRDLIESNNTVHRSVKSIDGKKIFNLMSKLDPDSLALYSFIKRENKY